MLVDNSKDRLPYDKTFTLLILVILLFPLRYLEIYIIFTTFLLLIFSVKKEISINKFSKFFILLIIYLMIGIFIRFFMSFEGFMRDFQELARYFPILIIFLFPYKWMNLKMENIIDSLFIYILIDTLISLFQINKVFPSFVNFISIFYNSEVQFEISLGISNRSLGLSSGPGQHASILILITLVFFSHIFFSDSRKKVSILGFLLGGYGIILTQSRTVFLAVLITIIICYIVYFIFSNNKVKVKLIISSFLMLIFSNYIIKFVENQKYLFTVFSGIENNNSYNARERKWADMFELMSAEPFYYIIGHGKHYMGRYSTSPDSEYMYILSVYGLPIFLLLITILIVYMMHVLRNWSKVFVVNKYLFTIIIAGLIVGWPSSYFVLPTTLFIMSLLFVLILQYDKLRFKS